MTVSGQQRRFEALMPRTALPCIADFVFAVVSRCFLWCAFFSVEDRHSVQFARPVSNNPQGLNRPGSFFWFASGAEDTRQLVALRGGRHNCQN